MGAAWRARTRALRHSAPRLLPGLRRRVVLGHTAARAALGRARPFPALPRVSHCSRRQERARAGMALAHASAGGADAAEVQRLLATVPAQLLSGAFGGDREACLDCVLRALLGAKRFDAAKHDLLTTLAWRRSLHVDQARRATGSFRFLAPRFRIPHCLRAPLRFVCALGWPSALTSCAPQRAPFARSAGPLRVPPPLTNA